MRNLKLKTHYCCCTLKIQSLLFATFKFFCFYVISLCVLLNIFIWRAVQKLDLLSLRISESDQCCVAGVPNRSNKQIMVQVAVFQTWLFQGAEVILSIAVPKFVWFSIYRISIVMDINLYNNDNHALAYWRLCCLFPPILLFCKHFGKHWNKQFRNMNMNANSSEQKWPTSKHIKLHKQNAGHFYKNMHSERKFQNLN